MCRLPSATASDRHRQAGVWALAVLLLTSVHHAYGAVIYATPWRLHIIHAAIPAAVLIVLGLWLARARPGTRAARIATGAAVALILAFPVGMIGLFEGGYNHVVKDLLYFGGGADAARRLFSGAEYVMPDDLLFEATGIAQLPLALRAAARALALVRTRAAAALR